MLWVAARDSRTPLVAKLLAAGVAAYAFSPIDLIPDFIPVLGLLDDVIIVPLGVWLAMKMIPAPLMQKYREKAASIAEKPVSLGAAVTIVAVWIALAASAAYLIARR